jgi:hypothetical protein
MSNYLGARIRVAFVESDVIFRTGLRALLEPRNDFEWVGEAASLSDFRTSIKFTFNSGWLLGPMPSFYYWFRISNRQWFRFS